MTEPYDADDERNPVNKDKPAFVDKNDAEEASHLSDDEVKAPVDTPLIESVSEDVSAEVGEFMEQAAQQNEAAADAVPVVRPGPARTAVGAVRAQLAVGESLGQGDRRHHAPGLISAP